MGNTKSLLTAERARELLYYDPDTGILRWKISPARNVKVGQVAGCKVSWGHLAFKIDGRFF